MRVKIEMVKDIKPYNETHNTAFTDSGPFCIKKSEFNIKDLVATFVISSPSGIMKEMKHIDEFDILKERFMQEGDDVTHLF